MRKIAHPTLFQAVLLGDHDRIAERIAAGQHPLTQIERCIEARGEAVATLMAHVHAETATVEIVGRVVQHLEMIDRYPRALEVLEKWLTGTTTTVL